MVDESRIEIRENVREVYIGSARYVSIRDVMVANGIKPSWKTVTEIIPVGVYTEQDDAGRPVAYVTESDARNLVRTVRNPMISPETVDRIKSMKALSEKPALPVEQPADVGTLFESSGVSVRVIMKDGEPWFVLRPICERFGMRTNDVLNALDDDEKGYDTIASRGGDQKYALISESGLYSTMLRSRHPEAKAFKRVVTHEILPSIRKTGSYGKPSFPTDPIELTRLLVDTGNRYIESETARRALEHKVEENAPKVAFAESVEDSDNLILIGALAKILTQNGYATGEVRLYATLREQGYLIKTGSERNLPTAEYAHTGIFRVVEREVVIDGKKTLKFTTKVTGKGQIYFVNHFCKKGE